ncbi:MAG: hypothetical protein QMC03_07505, partial [Flavobacteriales bacterium]
MKKFTFLFSLLLTQFAFAQWDGDFPGDGTFPWLADSIVVVNDTTFVINGDTISLGGNNWDENDNPWDDSTDVENSVIEILCSNGETFEVNLFEMINMPTEEFIFSICGEEGVDEDWNGPDWEDDFWDFDSTDVDNPWGGEDDIQLLLAELQMACASGDWMACGALELYAECTNGNTEACEELISIYEANEEEDNDNEWPWDNEGWDDSTD